MEDREREDPYIIRRKAELGKCKRCCNHLDNVSMRSNVHVDPAYRNQLLVVVQVLIKLHVSAKFRYVHSAIHRCTYP